MILKPPMKRLNDVFPDWLSGDGIFAVLQTFPVPWADDDISTALDLEYHGNHSGEKIVSPLVRKICSGEVLTNSEKIALATSIIAIYGSNWEKQWETLSLVYDPIENYSMTETMTDDETITEYGKTETRTDNLNHAKTGTETVTPNTTETTTPNLTTSAENTTHGFNSTDGVPTDEQTETATGTNTVTRTGTEQTSYNTSDTDTGTQTHANSGTDTQTRNYELKRSGNIGVTTSQQMIQSERNLWVWNFFNNVIFPDIDRALTIQVY